MTDTNRRAAIAAYKERKAVPGVFAVRCASGVWVGKAADIATIQNRIWFALRHGGHTTLTLQAAWAAHGADGLVFEVLETLVDEDMAIVRDKWLRDRVAYWRAELNAAAV